MNLIYMCVFHQESYIKLLKLLITSIEVKGNINRETTDILIFTSPEFLPLIQLELADIKLVLHYNLLNLQTLMEASSCKLQIFNYGNIDKYKKILYLDSDALINSDVNVLFGLEISSEKIYALEEGKIWDNCWGREFFDLTTFNGSTSAFSAGVLYFMNSKSIKNLFKDTASHITDYMSKNKLPPQYLDQPFLVFNSFIQNKFNNQIMKTYVENNPEEVSLEKIIYHFPGTPGLYQSKYAKMNSLWNKVKY